MEENKEKDEKFSKIKVFSSDDEKLKILGELLSNKSSREIIKLLMEKEYYTNEIADKLDLRTNLIIHHLKKLEELGLLEITQKKIVKKGNDHRYFRMIPNLFLHPSETSEEMTQKKTLKKIFKENIKIMSIGLAILSSWFLSRQLHQDNDTNLQFSGEDVPIGLTDWFNLNYEIWIPIVVISVFISLSIVLKSKINKLFKK